MFWSLNRFLLLWLLALDKNYKKGQNSLYNNKQYCVIRLIEQKGLHYKHCKHKYMSRINKEKKEKERNVVLTYLQKKEYNSYLL